MQPLQPWLVDGLSWVFDNIVKPILNAIETVYRFIAGKKVVAVAGTEPIGPQPRKKNDATEAETTNQLLTDIVKNTTENNQTATELGEAVTSGGPKTINITVSKFLDSINIHTANLTEGAGEMEDLFREMLARILAQGAATT